MPLLFEDIRSLLGRIESFDVREKNDGGFEKTSVRTPIMLTVEPPEEDVRRDASGSNGSDGDIIWEMLGLDAPDKIEKYNHNHGADGKFCEAGQGIVIDPTGSASQKQIVSKLTGRPLRDYSKEIASNVTNRADFKEASKEMKESFETMRAASNAARDAMEARKPKPKEEWTSDDELMDLCGIKPMTGEKEYRTAREKEQVAQDQYQKAAKKYKKILMDAQGGAKTNADFSEPKVADQTYPGFKEKTGVNFYDDSENLAYHGLKAVVAEMTPIEYLERCAANFNSSKDEESNRTATLAGQMLGLNKKNVEKLQMLMENGEQMYMPYLNVGLNDGAQEGRHRAMAAYNLGMEKIPVLYVFGNVSKSSDIDAVKEYKIKKKNDYHDPETGRFTFAPANAHGSEQNVSRETHGSEQNGWSKHIAAEREKLKDKSQREKALYAKDHHAASKDDCIKAMKDGKTDDLLNDYFRILEQNGDPKPTKKTKEQISIEQEGKQEGYREARLKHIIEDTGFDRAKAEETMSALDDFFDGWVRASTPVVDEYVKHAPAYDGIIYRGLAWDRGDDEDGSGYDKYINGIAPGKEIDMRGKASSWSSDEEVSRGFAHHGDNNADSVMLVCVGNRTSTPVDHLSTYGEKEVIASSKTKWTILYSETATWPSGARKTWAYVIEKGTDG